MDRILFYTIGPQDAGTSILSFLRSKDFSRNILNAMKTLEAPILLNEAPSRASALLAEGDRLRVHIPETERPSSIKPVPMALDILYEDEDLLVINKPADTPIHPSPGNYENTIANGAACYYARQGLPFIYRCINRLDRDTTGAFLLAKNALSASVLSSRMKERRIRRTYLAIVEGVPPLQGTVCAPIARAEGSVIAREVNFCTGEPAVTHYERLASREGYSLLKLRLDTGRTHQIRVHMSYLGFPLPGDYLYHPVYDRFSRQPLHSWKLAFPHPVSGQALEVTAPVPGIFLSLFPELS